MTNFTIDKLELYGNGMAYYVETSWANTIEYFCSPGQPGLWITEKWWKIMKLITVTATGNLAAGKCITWAGWSPEFAYLATDLSVVKAYSFS